MIKSNYKKIALTLILLAVGIALVNRYKNVSQGTEVVLVDKADNTMIVKRGVDSTEYAKVKQNVISLQQLRRSDNEEIVALRGELRKLRNVQAVTKVERQVSGSFSAPIGDTVWLEGVDTVRAGNFKFSDKWATIAGIFDHDSVAVSYKIKDDFTLLTKYERRGFLGLGRKDTYIELHSNNPNFETTSIRGYKVQRDRKRFYETRMFAIAAGVVIGIAIKTK